MDRLRHYKLRHYKNTELFTQLSFYWGSIVQVDDESTHCSVFVFLFDVTKPQEKSIELVLQVLLTSFMLPMILLSWLCTEQEASKRAKVPEVLCTQQKRVYATTEQFARMVNKIVFSIELN